MKARHSHDKPLYPLPPPLAHRRPRLRRSGRQHRRGALCVCPVNARRWIDAYKEREVANLCNGRSWITKGVPIPIQTLRQEIERGSYVEWTAEPQAGDMTILNDDEDADV